MSRVAWLRAAVLGANDGVVSTASLIVGVAAAAATPSQILTAGVAALVAGAMSMAAGEYVSVSSQADAERAALEIERRELAANATAEQAELAGIYERRGLTPDLARQVAEQLSAHDALGAHARDELGVTALSAARPVQAAFASASAFALGSAIPLLAATFAPADDAGPVVFGAALAGLVVLGILGARAGGAPAGRAVLRVSLLGAAAMAITAGVGALFGILA